MIDIAKNFALGCAFPAALAPTVAQGAEGCLNALVARPEFQHCEHDVAEWIANGQALTVSLSVVRMDTTELNSISTQGFDEDGEPIGGCVAFRQEAGSDTSPTCDRTVFFHATTENGG